MSAQWLGGWVPFPVRQADGQSVEDPTRARLDLGLVTLLAAVGRREGVSGELQLPFAFIARSDLLVGRQVDSGPGDLELRGRYVFLPGRARIAVAAGLTLPTGRYAARSGLQGFLENAQYLSLGRGAVHALCDADLRFALPRDVSLFAGAAVRLPVHDTRDGFRWGPEVRGQVGASLDLFGRLALGATFETQWRAQSSEIDLFTAQRAPSVNTGGVWLTASATAQVRLFEGLAAFAALRVPVWQLASGFQFIPGPGVFAGLGGQFELEPAAGAAPAKGRATLVDYWATWCEPCRRLEPLLEELAARNPTLEVRRIDVSDWSPEELQAAVPEANGLPVIQLYGADGALRSTLQGEAVFTVGDELPKVLP